MAIKNEILKTANDVLKKTPIEKVEIAKEVIQIITQKYLKNRIRRDLDVRRASLYWNKKNNQMKRVRYKKELDPEVLAEIKPYLRPY